MRFRVGRERVGLRQAFLDALAALTPDVPPKLRRQGCMTSQDDRARRRKRRPGFFVFGLGVRRTWLVFGLLGEAAPSFTVRLHAAS